MHADLVGAPGFRPAFEEGKLSIGVEDAPRRLGGARPWPAADRHALAVDGVPLDGAVDRTCRGAGKPANHGEIGFLCGAVGKLARERGQRLFCFRHEDATAGVLVETVDDPRAQRVPPCGDRTAVVENGVDQSALPMADRRMDHKSRRLVQTQQVIVLVEDIEGDIFRRDMGRDCGGGRQAGLDFVAGPDRIGGAGHGAVDLHQARGQRFLPAGSAEVRPLPGEPAVEAVGALPGGAMKGVIHGFRWKRWTFRRRRARFAVWKSPPSPR